MNRGLVVEWQSQNETTDPDALPSTPAHGYRFSHGFLWQVVLEELAQSQRERLIERIEAARSVPPDQDAITPLASLRTIEEGGDWALGKTDVDSLDVATQR